MNTPVSFELAKLLKEKGFDNESAHYYNENGEMLFDTDYPSLQPTKPHVYYDNPTIAEVVMWFYDKHGIWINIDWTPQNNGDEYPCEVYWYYFISEQVGNPEKTIDNCQTSNINSPTEAYFTAIECALKLI